MKKYIFLLALLITSQNSFANDDWDRICEDKIVHTDYYAGYSTCPVVDPSTGYHVWLNKWVPLGTSPTITLYLKEYDYTSPSCMAWVPYSHSEEQTVEVCRYVPREPYVTYASYEFGKCDFYSRNGFITWQMPDEASIYEIEEKSGNNWNRLFTGSANIINYTKEAGNQNKTYELRVRGKNSSDTGSWNYFSALVPKCGGVGGGIQPR